MLISLIRISALSVAMTIFSVVLLIPQITLSLKWGQVINTLSLTNASQYLPFTIADINTRVQGIYTLPSYEYICGALIGLAAVLSFIIVWIVKTIDCNWVNEE